MSVSGPTRGQTQRQSKAIHIAEAAFCTLAFCSVCMTSGHQDAVLITAMTHRMEPGTTAARPATSASTHSIPTDLALTGGMQSKPRCSLAASRAPWLSVSQGARIWASS